MKRVNFSAILPVTFLKEGDAFVAYTPALDLSTAGETLEIVKKNFHDAVQIFFEEASAMGTLDETLSEMGWRKDERDLKNFCCFLDVHLDEKRRVIECGCAND